MAEKSEEKKESERAITKKAPEKSMVEETLEGLGGISEAELIARIKEFLRKKYYKRLLGASSKETAVVVKYVDLDKFSPELGDMLRIEPDRFFSVASKAIETIDLPHPVKVRIYDFPDMTNIRDLRARHLGKFVCVEGVVRRASEIRPEIMETVWECTECGERIAQLRKGSFVSRPFECDKCGNRKGFKQIEKKMIDCRWITLEEPFELVEGERPSQVNLVLTEDLTSPEHRRMTEPGSRVKASGILRDMPKGKWYGVKLDFFMEANHIEPTEVGWERLEVTKKDEEEIKGFANDPDIYNKLVASLAPSLYGMSEIKESIILQLFGGVPRTLEDKTTFRGEIHLLLIGDPASGKCVTGDTRVVLKTGEVKSIEDIVENKLDDNVNPIDDGVYAYGNDDLLSLSLKGKIQGTKANIFWKRKSPKNLYIIETYSGKNITVTPTHPFFVCSRGFVVSKKASELGIKDFIAAPRRLHVEGSPQKIDIKVRREHHNTRHMKLPETTTPELCRFLAYILAEGYVQKRKGSKLVWFTNNSPALLGDFENCAGMFGLALHKRKPHKGKSSRDIYVSSIELVDFLEKIGPGFLKKSRFKSIPDIVLRASNEEVKAFLQAFFDCEACAMENEIELSTASKAMAEQMQVLLLRFGIVSQIHPMQKRATNSPKPRLREYYRLLISGSDIRRFREEIGFSLKKKNKILNSLKEKNSITDIVPNLSETLKHVREELKLTQFGMGVKRTTYQHFERGDRNPTVKTLPLIIKKMEKRLQEIESLRAEIPNGNWRKLYEIRNKLGISQDALARDAGISQSLISQYEIGRCGNARIKPRRKDVKETTERVKNALISICDSILGSNIKYSIAALKKLGESDIFWDRIKKIEKINSDREWVYDLQVPGVNNFIANQIFVHNSQLMKLVPQIVPRGKYVSGKGTTTAGLCTVYDTVIQLEDGRFMKIGDLVEGELKKGMKEIKPGIFIAKNPWGRKIASFDSQTMKIKPLKILKYWKIKAPSKMVKITTQTGKEIRVTPDNPIPVIKNGQIIWKMAKELGREDYVASPRILFSPRKNSVSMLKFIDSSSYVLNGGSVVDFLADKIKQETTIREYAKKIGLNENMLYHFWRSGDHAGAPRMDSIIGICNDLNLDPYSIFPEKLVLSQYKGHKITLPKELTEDMMYLIGLLAGDGSISRTKHGGYDIKFSNSEQWMLEAYKETCRNCIGRVPSYAKIRNRIPYMRFASKIFAGVLNNFGVPDGKKAHKLSVTEELSLLPDNLLKSYLQGVFDTDGSVSERMAAGSDHVELDSVSEFFIKGVQLFLLRFGILSKIRKRKGTISKIKGRVVKSKIKWMLEIRGLENLKLFRKHVGFRLPRKSKKLDRIIKKIRGHHTNIDSIPGIGELIRDARKELKLSARSLYGYKNYSYEDGSRRPSRNKLREIVLRMKEHGTGGKLEMLEKLANSDIFWEKIKEIKVFENKNHDYVYDVTVEDEHSFVANGMIIHNTASVIKDEQFMGGWVLEAGAMVLANKGILSIDEFEKMDPDDQVAMHEALESGTVSIAKASIVATLPAKTSVLAGGNPKFSRFDPYQSISKQINIPDTLLSRFDLKFILKDIPNAEQDRKLVEHILKTREGGYEPSIPKINPNFIKKYVAYAKINCQPRLTKESGRMLKNFYLKTRKKAESGAAPIPITLRQFEALMRLSESSAKIQLSPEVRIEDAKRAMRLMQYSLEQLGMTETGEIDVDKSEGLITSSERGKIRIVLDIINELSKKKKQIPRGEIEEEAKKQGIERNELDEILDKLTTDGMLFQPSPGYLEKV